VLNALDNLVGRAFGECTITRDDSHLYVLIVNEQEFRHWSLERVIVEARDAMQRMDVEELRLGGDRCPRCGADDYRLAWVEVLMPDGTVEDWQSDISRCANCGYDSDTSSDDDPAFILPDGDGAQDSWWEYEGD
jgi:hypothetical protein